MIFQNSKWDNNHTLTWAEPIKSSNWEKKKIMGGKKSCENVARLPQMLRGYHRSRPCVHLCAKHRKAEIVSNSHERYLAAGRWGRQRPHRKLPGKHNKDN